MIRSKKILRAAKGQDCTLQIVGCCNGDPATVVAAHLPDESHGMALKPCDLSVAFACSACHDAIDRRKTCGELEAHRDFYLRRANLRTLRILLDLDVLRLTS